MRNPTISVYDNKFFLYMNLTGGSLGQIEKDIPNSREYWNHKLHAWQFPISLLEKVIMICTTTDDRIVVETKSGRHTYMGEKILEDAGPITEFYKDEYRVRQIKLARDKGYLLFCQDYSCLKNLLVNYRDVESVILHNKWKCMFLQSFTQDSNWRGIRLKTVTEEKKKTNDRTKGKHSKPPRVQKKGDSRGVSNAHRGMVNPPPYDKLLGEDFHLRDIDKRHSSMFPFDDDWRTR